MPKLPKLAKRHSTIADIAALAGVAPMTVSRVINSNGYVSDRLRARVEKAVRQLDYSPNLLARSLKRQRSHVVGVLLPDIANPFSAELAHEIEEVLRARGYAAFLSSTDQNSDNEVAALNAFLEHRVDGLIVATMGTDLGNQEIVRFAGREHPIVLVGRTFHHPAVDRVTCAFWKGGHAAVEHLASLGHRRIAYIGVPDAASKMQRFRGYLEGMRDFGLTLRPDWIVGPVSGTSPTHSTQTDGYEGMNRLLALPKRPTAVFARNDYTAIGALRAARDAGLSIPGDLSIVGFDNVPLAAFLSPPLTTVNQPIAEQGRAAATLLVDRIEARHTGPGREISFDCELIVRGSSAPVSRAASVGR